jgi:hypothetical protein
MRQCDIELPDCEWWTQGFPFHTNFTVLPLGSYDIILGYDWLKAAGQMTVDWSEQHMEFQSYGQAAKLLRVHPDVI